MQADSFARMVRTSVSYLGLSLVVTLACAGSAQAAAARFVATTGNDANACTRPQPCRTLQRAVLVSPTGGVIHVLDSGLYGDPLVVSKGVTIVASGVSATLGSMAIDTATGVVTLRGLIFNGRNSGPNGIDIQNAGEVHIENCVVEEFSSIGIRLADNTDLTINGTVSRDNGDDGLRAVLSGPAMLLAISDSRFENNGGNGVSVFEAGLTITRTVMTGNAISGVLADESELSVFDSTAVYNGGSGFAVTGNFGEMDVEFSEARGNGNAGLFVGPAATARISNSAFTQNGTGIFNQGDTLTRLNNTVLGNSTELQGNALDSFAAQ
jgi:hypothetical protein